MQCEYPGCENTEVNEYSMCKQHEANYSKKPDTGSTRVFDLKRIQDGLKEMAKNAPAHIEPENIFTSYKTKEKEVSKEDIQKHLL